jgi:hypothetical protein
MRLVRRQAETGRTVCEAKSSIKKGAAKVALGMPNAEIAAANAAKAHWCLMMAGPDVVDAKQGAEKIATPPGQPGPTNCRFTPQNVRTWHIPRGFP